MQFKTIGESLDVINDINKTLDYSSLTKGMSANAGLIHNLKDATASYSTEAVKMALAQTTLDEKIIEGILSSKGLTGETLKMTTAEIAAKTATNGMAASQTGATGTTVGLTSAVKGLWTTLKANPLLLVIGGVTAGVTAAVTAWNIYKNHIEEVRQKTQEAADTFKDSSASVSDYTKRYEELQTALIKAKGNEEETYNIKKQLLELQTELNEKFGEEYGKIDLVTNAYEKQTEAIKNYNKEAANTFLNENRNGIETATKKMTNENVYSFSTNKIASDSETRKSLQDLVNSYSDKGLKFIERGSNVVQIHLTANPEDAYETLNEFSDDLRELARKLGDEHLFDQIFEGASDSMNKAKSIIDDYGEIYKQSLLADIASDDNKASVFNSAIEAVEAYNEAVLKSEDPYNDKNVAEKRENLEAIRGLMESDVATWGKYTSVISDVFGQANTKLLDFNTELTSNKDLMAEAQKLSGMSHLDLEGFDDSGTNESFNKLKESANSYELSVNELIDALVRLGIVTGEVKEIQNDQTIFSVSLETLNNQIDSIQSAYKTLTNSVDEYNQYGYLTADTLQALLSLDEEYLACLIDENGQLQINTTTYQALVSAKLADAEATAVQQAIEELGKVAVESKTAADVSSIGVIGEKAAALSSLSGSYSAVAASAAAAAQAEYLVAAYEDASGKNKEKANEIMSNLNTKLALIQNTSKNTSKSFGALSNHLNGFTKSSEKAKDVTDAFTKSMEKQKQALESQKDELEKQKQQYEDIISAINWFYDKQIKKQQEAIDNIEKQNELLNKQLHEYDGALNAIDRYYEKQQNALKDKIDALDKANDAKEKELALEKAQMALQEARSKKTKLIYSKGTGFTYQTDSKAIKDAEDNLENAQADKIKADLQAEIEKLQEYRDLWKEIPNIKQQAEEDSKMIELLGAEWESILLNGRIENLNSFKDQYIGIQDQINNNEQLIASYEEKIAYYEGLKEQWQQLTDKYKEDTYTQLLIGAFGNDFESVLLNGRTERWDKFANDYYNIQVKLKDITDKIESLAKRMEEYASRMESAANKAVSAVNNAVSAASKLNSISASPYQSATNHASKHGYASGFAKGGIVSNKDSGELDYIAKSIGEDHMVALKNGEAVIPENTVQNNSSLVKSLLEADGEEFTALFEDALNKGIVAEKNFDFIFNKMSPEDLPSVGNIINHKINLNDIPVNNPQHVVLNFNGDLSFPNIKSGNDAEMLIKELSTLSITAYQHSKKRN